MKDMIEISNRAQLDYAKLPLEYTPGTDLEALAQLVARYNDFVAVCHRVPPDYDPRKEQCTGYRRMPYGPGAWVSRADEPGASRADEPEAPRSKLSIRAPYGTAKYGKRPVEPDPDYELQIDEPVRKMPRPDYTVTISLHDTILRADKDQLSNLLKGFVIFKCHVYESEATQRTKYIIAKTVLTTTYKWWFPAPANQPDGYSLLPYLHDEPFTKEVRDLMKKGGISTSTNPDHFRDTDDASYDSDVHNAVDDLLYAMGEIADRRCGHGEILDGISNKVAAFLYCNKAQFAKGSMKPLAHPACHNWKNVLEY